MSEPQYSEPLSYASRTETDLLMRAYQVVGWYFLVMAGVAVVNVGVYAFVGFREGAGLSLALSLASSNASTMLAAIGGLGMIAGRSWGALFIIGCLALGIGVYAAAVALTSVTSTIGSYYGMANAIGGAVRALGTAFLPLAMWQLCRRYHAFG